MQIYWIRYKGTAFYLSNKDKEENTMTSMSDTEHAWCITACGSAVCFHWCKTWWAKLKPLVSPLLHRRGGERGEATGHGRGPESGGGGWTEGFRDDCCREGKDGKDSGWGEEEGARGRHPGHQWTGGFQWGEKSPSCVQTDQMYNKLYKVILKAALIIFFKIRSDDCIKSDFVFQWV